MDIARLQQFRFFDDIDLQFAGFIRRLFPETEPAVLLAAALVSAAAGRGDVCIDLAAPLAGMEADGKPPGELIGALPEPARLASLLAAHPAVTTPGGLAPLVLDTGWRLYLYRYWRYEHRLAEEFRRRAASNLAGEVPAGLPEALCRLFPEVAAAGLEGQALAAATAVLKPLCVVSGGPGTGKTTAAARIAALLLMLFGEDRFRIRLAAPTGKAAARLRDSIGAVAGKIDCPGPVRRALAADARTLHRLLGSVAGSAGFRHNAENPLPADAVMVDEASMVDAALMARLVEALPPDCRLILMGDRDQLASVEAGAVLGDVCGRGRLPGISRGWAESLQQATELPLSASVSTGEGEPGVGDAVVLMTRNFRFSAGSGIGRFSRAVKRGAPADALSIAKAPAGSEPVDWVDAGRPEAVAPALEGEIQKGYAGLFQARSPEKALELAAGFKILCAVNLGPLGVEALNRRAQEVLQDGGFIAEVEDGWYPGRPVMITRNDYGLGLFNGDLGVSAIDPASGALQVFFPGDAGPVPGENEGQAPTGGSGRIRAFSPFRIPEHRTAFAMTVHKSQGSEFDQVLLVLPGTDSPVLTRELIYTAVTRARRRVVVCGTESVLAAALSRRTQRVSGLYDALWAPKQTETERDRS